MPTPVALAKQCLTSEASHALDDAVAVARRRGHAQTTSLHAVSALLSLPSSALRDSAARSRYSAYSPRLRFKALDLCLTVSLDRLPSSQLSDDPPVSNSLMAAIKRSQANQRRQPENFHLYHQISHQHPSSVSAVKVDLQHLILSILDDPVVSRVFGEAGFRSSEIKIAILRPPPPQLFRYSRSRGGGGGAPVFLCNLTEQPDPGRRSSIFDENYRRIGEVLSRTRGRNPLLLGACAFDALGSFTEAVEKRKDGVFLPLELCGLRVICIGEQVSKFVTENCDDDKEGMRLTWKKISQMVEQCVGPGLVVNFGDLKCFVDESSGSGEAVRYIVGELGKLLEFNYDKLWLMGASASYDSYLRFVGKFPHVEKDWDLQLLPITSFRPSMIESYHKPKSSFMDSFVPFGGFFSSPADLKSSVSGSYYCVPHCHQCDERFEQEDLAASRVKLSASAPPSCQSKLPPWLHKPELGSAKILNIKTIGDGVALDTEPEPHKKLDKTFHHHTQQFPDENTCQTFVGFESLNNKKEEDDNNHSSKTTYASSSENIDLNSQVSKGEQMISTSPSSSPFSMVFKLKQEKLNSRLSEIFQKAEDLESGDLRSCNMSNSSMCDGIQMSPASVTSVTTELGLGLCSSHTTNKSKKEEHIISSFDLVNGNTFHHRPPSSSCLSSDFGGQVDMRNPKVLFEALSKKVGWQEEALRVIVRTLACCHTRRGKHHRANQRGDIWMNFVGPDKLGKKKIAVSLAEFLCGSQESFIFVDLKSEEMKGYDVNFRGKTTLDFIVGELCKKPLSVVFLENVDKADMLAQNSLSQAIKTGKITDSHGREVGVNNSIFVTSFSILQNSSMPIREPSNYSEDRILRTKGGGMKIKVEHVIGDNSIEGIPNLVFINKRKLISDNESHDQHKISETAKRAHKESNCVLDLNLPAEQNELQDMEDGNHEEDGSTENQNLWCQDLYDKVDETVVFKPYDFDALAERVMKMIRRNFHKILGSECLLQIESEVMEQLLAAAYVSDNYTEVEDWTDQVLSRGFAEVHRRYNPSAPSVVKLGTYQDQASGVFLPTKILVE